MSSTLDRHRRYPRDPELLANGRRRRRRLWPMIVLPTPKGWTGPKLVDGQGVEGTFRAHQVPLSDPLKNPDTCAARDWMKGYRPEELFDAHGASSPTSPRLRRTATAAWARTPTPMAVSGCEISACRTSAVRRPGAGARSDGCRGHSSRASSATSPPQPGPAKFPTLRPR